MLLAEEGVIDLDEPLSEYLDEPLPEYPAYADLMGDDRHRQITARMALSHSIGFPNWRFLAEDGKLSRPPPVPCATSQQTSRPCGSPSAPKAFTNGPLLGWPGRPALWRLSRAVILSSSVNQKRPTKVR